MVPWCDAQWGFKIGQHLILKERGWWEMHSEKNLTIYGKGFYTMSYSNVKQSSQWPGSYWPVGLLHQEEWAKLIWSRLCTGLLMWPRASPCPVTLFY